MKNKLKISSIKVKSFVTMLGSSQGLTINGGVFSVGVCTASVIEAIACPSGPTEKY